MKGPGGNSELPGWPCSPLFLPEPTGDLSQSQHHKLLLHQPPALPGAPQWSELFSEIVCLPKQKGVADCYRLGLIDCYRVTDSKT